MPLAPESVAFLQKIELVDRPKYQDIRIEEARSQFEQLAVNLGFKPESVFKCEDLVIPGNENQQVPIRIYRPVESPSAMPVMIWLHGGGGVLGSVNSYDSLCRQLALKSNAIVVSVEYRLAPEHPFPAGLNDSFAVLEWVAANAQNFDGDASRIGIAGDSAGGNLAAVCALLARDRGAPELCFQLLVYPGTAAKPNSASTLRYAEDHFLTLDSIKWFQECYLTDERNRHDFRFAPLEAMNHANLPPTLMILAEYDPLTDEGIAYAKALEQAGNKVTLSVYPGMLHGFFSLPAVFSQSGEAVDEASAAIKDAFAASKRGEDTRRVQQTL